MQPDWTNPANQLHKSVFKGQWLYYPVDFVEYRKGTFPIRDFLILLVDNQLPLKVVNRSFQGALQVSEFLALGILCKQFCSSDALFWYLIQ